MSETAWYDWAAKAAARMDSVLAPVRRAACTLAYQEDDGVSPGDVVGEVDTPIYHAPENLSAGSVQATLDGLRAYKRFQDGVPAVDEALRDRYGSGVDTAIMYGSTVRGVSLFGDAAVHRADVADGIPSDLDWVFVLETCDDAVAAEQRETVGDYLDDDPLGPVNAEVYGYHEFVDELRDARHEADSLDGLRDQWTMLRWPDRSVPIPYLARFRQPVEGYMTHDEFDGAAVRTELEAGMDAVLDDTGCVQDEVQPDLALMGFNTGSYEERLQDLETNHRLRRGQG